MKTRSREWCEQQKNLLNSHFSLITTDRWWYLYSLSSYQIFYRSDSIGSKRSKWIVLSFTTYKKQQKPYGLTLFKSPFKVLKQSIKVVYYLTLLFWQWKNEGDLHDEKVISTRNNEVVPQSHYFEVLKTRNRQQCNILRGHTKLSQSVWNRS